MKVRFNPGRPGCRWILERFLRRGNPPRRGFRWIGFDELAVWPVCDNPALALDRDPRYMNEHEG